MASIYTQSQIDQYLSYINFPKSDFLSHELLSLSLLTSLLRYQLAAVPFESLSLHYSPTHLLSLDPQDLYEKIVGTGRGGYCMENNAFFGTILRSLGFQVLSVGGRVSGETQGKPRGSRYSGWSHMVNIVIVEGQRYVVDIGFGGANACQPIPLKDGIIISGVWPQQLRLTYKALPQSTDPEGQRMWIYSQRPNEDVEWSEGFAFTEVEFFPEDFRIMNTDVMLARQSFFVQNVVCMRFVLGKWADDSETSGDTTADSETTRSGKRGGQKKGIVDGSTTDLIGTWTLFGNRLTQKLGDSEVTSRELKSEEERVQALKDCFGIELSQKEQDGIKGLASELKGPRAVP